MKETKISTKLLLAVISVLALICIFNINTVKATDEEIADEYIQNILNAIPDSFELNLKESEYEKADSLIKEKLDKIFGTEQIDTSKVEVEARANGISPLLIDDINNFYKGTVTLTYLSVNGTEKVEKEFNIKYNNTENHNQADKEYINSVSLVNKDYFIIDFEDWKKIVNNRPVEYVSEIVEDYYTKQFNDNSVQVKIWTGIGDVNGLFSSYMTYYVAVFKDDMLYRYSINGSKVFRSIFVNEITVSSNVSDDDFSNYVINFLQNNIEYSGYINSDNSVEYIVKSIEKGTDENITNGYTITCDMIDKNTQETTYQFKSPIVINREKTISTTDTETNIKLDTTTDTVPSGTELVVNKITTGNEYNKVATAVKDEVKNFVTYNITLVSEGVEIQPNGKVKISIPIPTDFDKNNLVVYRVEDNGTKTKYDVTVNGNYAIFETDHFSAYVLAEKKVAETNTETPTTNNDDKELDETPKTGVETESTVALALTSILSLIGIVALKRF